MNTTTYFCEQTRNDGVLNARKCSCDLKAPPERIMRLPEYNREMACFFCNPDLSGDKVIYAVLTELYDHHTGRLFDADGKEIEIDENADPAAFDQLFGEDGKRWINRYREKAVRTPTNLLDKRCVFAVKILAFARQIHLCRTQGRCSQ